MRQRAAAGVLAAVAAAALVACGTDSSDDRTDATSVDPALLECGEATVEDPTWQLLDVDLTQATWDMPDGFVETFEYGEDLPVEHIQTFWAAEPEQDPVPLNVLTVVVYSQMSWGDDVDDCGRVPITEVDDRVLGYNEHNDAEAITEATETEIAGLPALEQDVSLEQYSYRGYWVFGRTEMIHLYCQWTDDAEKDRVLAGCEDLVASLVVPGA